MCLERLDQGPFKERKENGYNVGYKQFQNANGKLTSFWGYCRDYTDPYPKNKWINEKDWRPPLPTGILTTYEDEKYKTGFHIWIGVAKDLFCKAQETKIYYRTVVAKGWQDGRRIVVAKEILIPEF